MSLTEHEITDLHRCVSLKGPVKVLESWISQCEGCQDGHLARSKSLRALHYGASTLSIVFGAIASVLSALVSSGIPKRLWVTGFSTLFSAASAAIIAVVAVMEPSARRTAHLNAELQYGLLARDMRTHLASHSYLYNDFYDDSQVEIDLSRFQRRLDNVESSAPPL